MSALILCMECSHPSLVQSELRRPAPPRRRSDELQGPWSLGEQNASLLAPAQGDVEKATEPNTLAENEGWHALSHANAAYL